MREGDFKRDSLFYLLHVQRGDLDAMAKSLR